jgi:hypothetical protein
MTGKIRGARGGAPEGSVDNLVRRAVKLPIARKVDQATVNFSWPRRNNGLCYPKWKLGRVLPQ